MKHVFTLLLLFLLASPSMAQDENPIIIVETTTYYFIRHAEKDRSDPANKDQNLLQKGVFRAARWSYILEHIKFDAVYSSDYNRTRQTAHPTAEKNNVEITIYNPNDPNNEEFVKNTKGKTVLIVGHSDSTPTFVNAVIGKEKYEHIDDGNNANLYIVTISANGEITDTLLVID
jgi:broad specificity phosphatase PhoE